MSCSCNLTSLQTITDDESRGDHAIFYINSIVSFGLACEMEKNEWMNSSIFSIILFRVTLWSKKLNGSTVSEDFSSFLTNLPLWLLASFGLKINHFCYSIYSTNRIDLGSSLSPSLSFSVFSLNFQQFFLSLLWNATIFGTRKLSSLGTLHGATAATVSILLHWNYPTFWT